MNDPSSSVIPGRLMAKANHPAPATPKCGWLVVGFQHCEIINRVVVSQKESADNPGMVRSVLSHSFFSWDLNCCGSFCNVISQPQWNYGNQQMIVSLSASWQVACLKQRMLLIGSNWVIFQFSPFAAVCAAWWAKPFSFKKLNLTCVLCVRLLIQVAREITLENTKLPRFLFLLAHHVVTLR